MLGNYKGMAKTRRASEAKFKVESWLATNDVARFSITNGSAKQNMIKIEEPSLFTGC